MSVKSNEFGGKVNMKRRFMVIMTTICMIFAALAFPTTALAKDPLDEIQNYTIQVDMRPDGTMDIKYHLEWKVLDSTSEGPLEWVKIGCPNYHVDEITALTHNIKDIKYISDGGAYIRVDFDRKYEENEIVEFDYSIHQSYMYVIEEDAHLCRYSFTPGWFDDIEVKNIQIKWSDSNVIECNSDRTENNYLIWEGHLQPGERLNASVKYNLDAFTTNPDEQYTEDSGDDLSFKIAIAIIVVLGVIGVVSLLMLMFGDDGYHGGFGGGGSHVFISSHSTRSSCACVSHCACACACAGGGRAGCSKKDFYRYKVRTSDLMKVLDEDLEDEKNN